MTEEVKDPSQQTSEAEESMKNAAEAAETDAAADVATETEAAAAEADKTAELQQKIEALEKELADEKEKYLRLDAEYYNYRTRSLKEKQDAYDNALTKAVTEVLSVIDNFERALTAECADANFKKGVEMIFRQYTAILEKLGVGLVGVVKYIFHNVSPFFAFPVIAPETLILLSMAALMQAPCRL